MTYLALCLYLLRGPVPPEWLPDVLTAECLFDLLERRTGIPVTRAEPDLDQVMITFRDKGDLSESVVKLVLRAHGVYVHQRIKRDGSHELVASRSRKRPPVAGPAVICRRTCTRRLRRGWGIARC